MSLIIANLPRAGVLLAIFAAGFGVYEERFRGARSAAAALEDREVQRLCAKEGYPSSYYWERFRTMGGRLAVVRSEPLAVFLKAGTAVRFNKEEVDRMLASGAMAEDAPLVPGSVWTKDPALAQRFQRASEAAGLPVGEKTYKGRIVFSVPSGARFNAGFDPERISILRALGLTPAYLVQSRADLNLALEDTKPSVLWIAADLPGFRRSTAIFDSDQVRRVREVPPGVGPRQVLAASRGERFLLFNFDDADSVEGSLDRFRDRFSAFRRAGLGAGPVAAMPMGRQVSIRERWARRLLLVITFVFGPFLVLRFAGLRKTKPAFLALVFFGAVLAGLVGRLGAAPVDYWLAPWYPVGGSWIARHWPAVILGWPVLALGRRWAGFAAPLGVVWVVSNVRLPVETALFEASAAAAVGLVLGGGIFTAKRAYERG